MSGGDYLTTGLTFGLTVVVMAYAVGRVSGGHFNPAITVGAAFGGRLPWSATPIYVGAQLLGGLVAGALLFALMHGFEGYTAEGNIGANSFGDQGSGYAMWAAFLLEMLLTLIFLYVVLGVTDARNDFQALMGPLAIGLSLAMIHFASMGATGTSVNPARSIGVGVFAGADAIIQLWLFVLAPLLGAAIAGLTYPVIFGQGAEPVAGSGLNFGGGRKNQNQYVPGNYEAQWNQGQQGGWGQPGAAWGAPPQQGQPQGRPQQWGAPPSQQPDPSYGAPQSAPGQFGQPDAPPQQAPQQPAQQPGQQPGQPGQWGAPPAGGQPGAPGHWGNPEGDDDGRTQVRRPD
jgi:aquaporin Z